MSSVAGLQTRAEGEKGRQAHELSHPSPPLLMPCPPAPCTAGGGLRRMAHVDAETGTVYLNSATVPRVRKPIGSAPVPPGAYQHHLLVVDMVGGLVETAHDVWVQVAPAAAAAAGEAPAGDGSAAVAASAASSPASNGAGSSARVQPPPQQSQQLQPPPQLPPQPSRFHAQVVSRHEVVSTLRGEGGGVVKRCWNAHRKQADLVALSAATAARHTRVLPACSACGGRGRSVGGQRGEGVTSR